MKYALRLCHEGNKMRSCVELYKIMGHHEEAIKLALNLDDNFQTATAIAKLVEDQDDQLSGFNNDPGNPALTRKKRLWLMVAKAHVAKNRIKDALNVVQECQFLSIEDILPDLPDSMYIGEFKNEIVDSLKVYNDTIHRLKNEMDASLTALTG